MNKKKTTKYKPIYNIITLIITGFSFINSFFLLKFLGISKVNDSLNLTVIIINTLNLLSLMFHEQFLVFYEKQSNKRSFFVKSSVIIFFIQILLILIIFVNSDFVIKIFMKNADSDRINIVRNILRLYIFSQVLMPLNVIGIKLLNYHEQHLKALLLQLFLPLFIFSYMFYSLISDNYNIRSYTLAVVVATLGTSTIIYVFSFYYVYANNRENKSSKVEMSDVGVMIKNSILLRVGHNINNVLMMPIISNAIVTLPVGNVTLYSYAKRFSDLVYSVGAGSYFNIMYSELVKCRNQLIETKNVILDYIKSSLRISIILIIGGIVCIPLFLPIITSGKIIFNNALTVSGIFILLNLWVIQMIVENPFATRIAIENKFLLFVLTNIVNILIIKVVSTYFVPKIGVYGVPISIILGQLWSNVIYINNGIKIIRRSND